MRKILLVDDDDIFRGALQLILRNAGYEVIPAPNGKMALSWLEQNQSDVIISDIRMPGIDGIELTKQIRLKSNIPIILITGFSQILETHEAHAIGANEFLTKPFKREEILETVEKCLNLSKTSSPMDDSSFCRLALNDFLYGKQIVFSIFLRLSESKYVKIAHQGDELSSERIAQFRQKGIDYLYLQNEDFRHYLGINIKLMKLTQKNKEINQEKKINLLRHTGEILQEQVYKQGLDRRLFTDSRVFIENTLNIITEDTNVTLLLEALRNHGNYLFAHSLGVSLYSVMIAHALKWEIASHKFKLAAGALFHEIGCKEIPLDLLQKPRISWTLEEVKMYESHPERGLTILKDFPLFSLDILQIVIQHHENCIGRGFPKKLRRNAIYPMAKIVAVADEFCYRVITNPSREMMTPAEAIKDMLHFSKEYMDAQFLNALGQLFNFNLPEEKSKTI